MAEVVNLTIKANADLSDVRSSVNALKKSFEGLKLPKNLGIQLDTQVKNLNKLLSDYDKKRLSGAQTPNELKQLDKLGAEALISYKELLNTAKEIRGIKIDELIDIDQSKLQEAKDNIHAIYNELNNLDANKVKNSGLQVVQDQLTVITEFTKSKKIQSISEVVNKAFDKGKFGDVYAEFKKLYDYLGGSKSNAAYNRFNENARSAIDNFKATFQSLSSDQTIGPILEKLAKAEGDYSQLTTGEVERVKKVFEELQIAIEKNPKALADLNNRIHETAKTSVELSKGAQSLERQVESYFGLNAIFRTIANMGRQAMETVKALDKAMTETAVVTNFSVGDMWEKLPIYTAEANKLGSTIEDVYRATTLYYQQGLNTTQSMGLAVETLKMARIAGMDAKDATNAMTAALRGFNLELNEVSARRINDVYSELAAITASDTQEISTAMEKVASLAHNAGMELETTSAFLAQMIETTREAPENLGTALKTVVARFQEMKQDPTKLIDSEGVMLDANKVDKALKSIGVNLLNANGEFRKLDDVFLEIASRWDTLSMGQQRYIATMAAGSRQQSRFIAMMSNYGRTMELVNAANDAAGASQKQFEKTLESMDTKLNQLKNAWDQFIMGLMNNTILKSVVDFGTGFLDVVNKIINSLSGGNGLIKSILTLASTFSALTGARTILSAGITSGFKWFKGEIGLPDLFKNVIFSGRKNIISQFDKMGVESAVNYKNAFLYNISSLPQQLQYILNKNVVTPNMVLNSNFGQQLDKDVQVQLKGAKNEDQIKAIIGEDAFEQYVKQIDWSSNATKNFVTMTTGAGSALQSFGTILRGTPLAPFGMALQVVGTSLTSVGRLFVQVGKNGQVLNTGIKALVANLGGPLGIAALAAAAAIGVLIYASKAGERRLKALGKIAQDASEQLDTVKQNVTEFKSALEEIKNYDDTFNNLVPGTIEFNEKLVESNQLILDLIDKYEVLRELVQIDEFGRLSIPTDDLNNFYETLVQQQGNAQAVALLTDLDVAKEKYEQAKAQAEELSTRDIQQYTYDEYGNLIITKEYEDYIKSIEKADLKVKQLTDEYISKKESDTFNAVIASFAGLDLKDTEATGKLVADYFYDSYLEEAKKNFEGRDKDAVEYYANQRGLNFDEVWEDKDQKKAAIAQAPIIYALNNIHDTAESVDSALQSVDRSASHFLGTEYGDVSKAFTQLYTRDATASADLVKEFASNPSKITDLINYIADENEDALRALKPDFSGTTEELVNEIIKDLETSTPLIAEAQMETYKSVIGRFFSSGASSKLLPNLFGKTTTHQEAAQRTQLSTTQFPESCLFHTSNLVLCDNNRTQVTAASV